METDKQSEINNMFCRKKKTWIGCNDLAKEGRFVWSYHNKLVTFSNWAPGEPNNDDGNEHCCMVGWVDSWHLPGQWNDSPCSLCYRFICKK